MNFFITKFFKVVQIDQKCIEIVSNRLKLFKIVIKKFKTF